MIFSTLNFPLARLALQNENKDYVIFSYFRNFVAKSDQKQKKKNGMNETIKTRTLLQNEFELIVDQGSRKSIKPVAARHEHR